MKTIISLLFKGLFIFSGLILSTVCSTRNVSMQLLIPAEITIPQEIKSVGILNRSLPQKNEQFLNVLEGFITGESVLADREGSFNCIRGVEARLNELPRLKAFAIESDQYRGTGTRQFPEVLDWNSVDALCRQNKVDAILSLETFDSDFGIKKSTSDRKEKVNGREVVHKEYHADLRVEVNTGWRLYDNIHRTIVDKVSFSDRKEWTGNGSGEQAALDDLPSKRHTINESGKHAGIKIANRLSPNWRTENRSYFVKGNDDFKAAKEQVKFNNWEAAILTWKRLSESPDPVIAGRACYNLALASERKGDIDLAIVWVEKAMKIYHIKQARNYSEVLSHRKENDAKLEEQMR